MFGQLVDAVYSGDTIAIKKKVILAHHNCNTVKKRGLLRMMARISAAASAQWHINCNYVIKTGTVWFWQR